VPGERLVLVLDNGAFSAAYPDLIMGGDYDGGLGNEGDVFSLESQGRGVLWTVSYGDSAPWPGSADGLGRGAVDPGFAALDE
jgi:hypothetical protein